MPGTNQFLPFATATGANVLTPAAYAALPASATGFQSGIASSQQVNTPLRQSTFVAAAIAQLISNNNLNALDDGNLTAFVANLASAINTSSNTPGTVALFAMQTAPAGWVKANGAAVSRTTYASLFASIGTTFGVGDGSTTFNLPDFRGEFLRGWDNGRGIDNARAFGAWQADAIGAAAMATNGKYPKGFLVVTDHTAQSPATDASDGVQAGVAFSDGGLSSISRTALSTATETRPRNVALLACIKY